MVARTGGSEKVKGKGVTLVADKGGEKEDAGGKKVERKTKGSR